MVCVWGGGGGATKCEGGHAKFYPCEKGRGVANILAMLKGGGNKFWGSSFNMGA